MYAGRNTIRGPYIENNVFWSEWPAGAPKDAFAGACQGVSAFDDVTVGVRLLSNLISANHHHGSSWHYLKDSVVSGNTLFNSVCMSTRTRTRTRTCTRTRTRIHFSVSFSNCGFRLGAEQREQLHRRVLA